MRVILRLAIAFSLLAATACGGSSGGDSFSGTVGENGQKLVIMSPADNSVFLPGQTISFVVETENFSLAVPLDRRTSTEEAKHHIDPNEADIEELAEAAEAAGLIEGDEAADEEMAMMEESEHSSEDGHSHDESSTHGHAVEGHYHVYLDGAQDTDAHVTEWANDFEYALPNEISAGNHSLRFELRDNEHVKVGAETIYFFSVDAN
ncbi:MAG: hypothetical protein KDD66_04390 [Bdellovibrionales bacterium]|nr:hypothetical protein [Bdellovibrionales bacterium]